MPASSPASTCWREDDRSSSSTSSSYSPTASRIASLSSLSSSSPGPTLPASCSTALPSLWSSAPGLKRSSSLVSLACLSISASISPEGVQNRARVSAGEVHAWAQMDRAPSESPSSIPRHDSTSRFWYPRCCVSAAAAFLFSFVAWKDHIATGPGVGQMHVDVCRTFCFPRAMGTQEQFDRSLVYRLQVGVVAGRRRKCGKKEAKTSYISSC